MTSSIRGVIWVLGVLWGTAACSSTVWFGHTPDRSRRIEVIERGGQQSVVVDGTAHATYDAIGVTALTLSPDGTRLGYPAELGGRWVVVIDGRPGAPWDGIGEIVFSPDSRHVAYEGLRGGSWHVVRDGKPDVGVEAVFADTLTFSPDSRHLAYVAATGATAFVVLDGKPEPGFERIAQLRFGAGGQLAYVGQRRGRCHVVLEGVLGASHPTIVDLGFGGPAGETVAYLAGGPLGWRAFVDGRASDRYDGAAGLMLGQPRGAVAYAVQRGNQAWVVHRSAPGPPYDGIRFETIAFTPRGELTYVARLAGRYAVALGGGHGPWFDWVEPPAFAARRWGYLARLRERWFVVIDGRVRPLPAGYTAAADLTFSPDGGRFGFVAVKGERAAVVLGNGEHDFDVVVADSLVFSRDGRHWAALVGDLRREQLFVTIDGSGRRPFDVAEAVAAVELGSRRVDEQLLHRWVAAELQRATQVARLER